MKQVLIKAGRAIVEEVPAPRAERGTMVVRIGFSCISPGTELGVMQASGQALWQRAARRPEEIMKVVRAVAREGWGPARHLVRRSLTEARPVGYSAAGHVVEVGEEVTDIRPGDPVACAGDQHAYHAEIVRVPRNLAVPIPAGVDLQEASTVALGAIALHAVRRADLTLGETVVVIGLGFLGQLAVQLSKIAGCRVIGTDLDPARVALARECGLDMGLEPEHTADPEAVLRHTDGTGADAVIITAAGTSSAAVVSAFRMCRRKGRVVLVGDVGLRLNRADLYQKEIDFRVSTSYGPGRYDRRYEEEGLDYPLPYVRWTANRNMREYLRLVAEGRILLRPLLAVVYPIDDAPAAYERLRSGQPRPLCVLLSYPQGTQDAQRASLPNPTARTAAAGRVRIAVVGAGEMAKRTHLPNLGALGDSFHLQAVVSRTGHNAMLTAKEFGAGYAATEFQRVLEDPDVDAVLIATRHHLHAPMVLEALRAGKHILVEKPLGLTAEELEAVAGFFGALPADRAPVLLTGFNRRFSPLARRVREFVRARRQPMILNYRMNAGALPPDHWVYGSEGGGRNLGEACHVYDLLTFLTGARARAVYAQAIQPASAAVLPSDNFVATVTFEDGSAGTVTYTALGAPAYPKDHLEVYVDGRVLVLEDFRRLRLIGPGTRTAEVRGGSKGHREMLEAFGQTILSGGAWPIPLWQQLQATEIALQVERQIMQAR